MEILHNAKHWRERAEEARVHAEQMSDSDSRRMMLAIAAEYDHLAERADKLARKAPPHSK